MSSGRVSRRSPGSPSKAKSRSALSARYSPQPQLPQLPRSPGNDTGGGWLVPNGVSIRLGDHPRNNMSMSSVKHSPLHVSCSPHPPKNAKCSGRILSPVGQPLHPLRAVGSSSNGNSNKTPWPPPDSSQGATGLLKNEVSICAGFSKGIHNRMKSSFTTNRFNFEYDGTFESIANRSGGYGRQQKEQKAAPSAFVSKMFRHVRLSREEHEKRRKLQQKLLQEQKEEVDPEIQAEDAAVAAELEATRVKVVARQGVLSFFGLANCHLFAKAGHVLSVSNEEIDSLINSCGGLAPCRAALVALNEAGQQFWRFDDLVQAAVQRAPIHSAVEDFSQRPSNLLLNNPSQIQMAEEDLSDEDFDEEYLSDEEAEPEEDRGFTSLLGIPQVELYVTCKDVPREVTRNRGPVVVCYKKDQDTNGWVLVGRTECVKTDHQQPKFKKTFVIDQPQDGDELKFLLYGVVDESIDVELQQLVGYAVLDVRSVIEAPDNRKIFSLVNSNQEYQCALLIQAKKPVDTGSANDIEFAISCSNLANKDVLSDCDPTVVLFLRDPHSGKYEMVSQTEIVRKQNNPVFQDPLTVTTFAKIDRVCRIAVFDADESGNFHENRMLGQVSLPVSQLTKRPVSLPLCDASGTEIPGCSITFSNYLEPVKEDPGSVSDVQLLVKGSNIVTVGHNLNLRVRLMVKNFEHKWEQLDQTEFMGCSDPIFCKKLKTQRFSSVDRQHKLQLLHHNTLLGEAEFPLELFCNGIDPMVLKLLNNGNQMGGGKATLTVYSPLIVADLGKVSLIPLSIGCRKLPHIDAWAACDPIVAIYRLRIQASEFEFVCQTKRKSNSTNPNFAPIHVEHYSKVDQTLKAVVYDSEPNEILMPGRVIGEAQFLLSQYQELVAAEKQLVLPLTCRGEESLGSLLLNPRPLQTELVDYDSNSDNDEEEAELEVAETNDKLNVLLHSSIERFSVLSGTESMGMRSMASGLEMTVVEQGGEQSDPNTDMARQFLSVDLNDLAEPITEEEDDEGGLYD